MWAKYLISVSDLYTQTTNVHSLYDWPSLLLKYNNPIYKFLKHSRNCNSILYIHVHNYFNTSTYPISKYVIGSQSNFHCLFLELPDATEILKYCVMPPFSHVWLQRYNASVVLCIINTNYIISVHQQTYLQKWQDNMMVKIYIWTLTNTVVDKVYYCN